MELKLSQKNFDGLVEALNHRMTNIEHDVKWMKKIVSWQVALLGGIFITILGVVIKFLFFG